MPVGDKQKLITTIVGEVLGSKPDVDISFEWFVNKHSEKHFGIRYQIINDIFISLGGNIAYNRDKRASSLRTDAYFGNKYNFLFEFDEFQHFSSARLQTFNFYPSGMKLNFNLQQWKTLCEKHKQKANKYRISKKTVDFDFNGGRTAQRAYFDCFRDLLPDMYGLNPTLRINEFEVSNISSNNSDAHMIIEQLLKNKLLYLK